MKEVLLQQAKRMTLRFSAEDLQKSEKLIPLDGSPPDQNEVNFAENDTEFYGHIVNHRVTGQGQLQFSEEHQGLINYKGNISKNRPNGYGELSVNRDKVFKGNFLHSKIQGLGEFNTQSYIYNGQWLDNKFSGYGRIVNKKFSLYEGQFLLGERHGLGIEIYNNSDLFIGEFRADKKNGMGVYFFHKGGYYYGFFKDDERDGLGEQINERQVKLYYGFWKNNKYHGRGMEQYLNGSKYDGYFVEGQREGVGIMEYSSQLVYVGQWKNGLKEGYGIVEFGNKKIYGFFEGDQYCEPREGDYNFTDELLKDILSEDIPSFLADKKYRIPVKSLSSHHTLYMIIKSPIQSFVLDLVQNGTMRLHLFILIKNLFNKQSFEEIQNEIQLLLKFEPNKRHLYSFWQIAIAEVFTDKKSFPWEKWTVTKEAHERLFGDTATGDRIQQLSFKVSEKKYNLQISEQIVAGEGPGFTIEGVVKGGEAFCKFFDRDKDSFKCRAHIRFYPYLITLSKTHYERPKLLCQSLVKYTGKFYFGDDQTQPRDMTLYLGVDTQSKIYNVTLDSVGMSILVGEVNKKQGTAVFTQFYHDDYRIYYEAFLFNGDKIQGYWQSTNLRGQFILRKDKNFKFVKAASSLVAQMEQVSQTKAEFAPEDLSLLREDLENSILSVVIKNKQGGIPKPEKAKSDDSKDLFQKYKNQNKRGSKLFTLDEEKLQQIQNKLMQDQKTSSSSREQNSSKQQSRQESLHKDELDSLLDGINEENFKMNNEQLIQEQTPELPPTKSVVTQSDLTSNTNYESRFDQKLNEALKTLRQVNREDSPYDFKNYKVEEESVNWVGVKTTLGKEQRFIVKNMYIIMDQFEGIYVNEEEEIFELVGSASFRTKEFEIVGLSQSKEKSIKMKGTFEGFKLKGKFSQYPSNGVNSLIELKMTGQVGKMRMETAEKKALVENLDAIVNISDKFLFGIAHDDERYFFLLGFRHPQQPFFLEVYSTLKDLKKMKLIQVQMGRVSSQNKEGEDLLFCDDKYRMEIKF